METTVPREGEEELGELEGELPEAQEIQQGASERGEVHVVQDVSPVGRLHEEEVRLLPGGQGIKDTSGGSTTAPGG